MIGSQGIAEAGGKFPIKMVATLVMASPGTVLGRPGARSQKQKQIVNLSEPYGCGNTIAATAYMHGSMGT